MTGLDDENRELDDFLARRSVLHRRLANRDYHEPSPELDRLVLNKAREAIEIQASTPMYRAPRWALPVGLAASVVLALAVVVNVARMHGGGGGYPVAASASPAANAAPGLAEGKAVPMAPPPVALAKQSTQSFAPELRTDSADEQTNRAEADGAQDALLASNAPISAPLSATSQDAARSAATIDAKSRAHADVQMPAEAHAASDASAVAGASAGNLKPASPAARATANSPRFARAEAPVERRVLPARDIALREAEPSAAPAPAPAPLLSDKAKHRDPQVWMREIEQLRLAGKSADADREITAFRKVFPSLPLSPAALGRDPRPTK